MILTSLRMLMRWDIAERDGSKRREVPAFFFYPGSGSLFKGSSIMKE